MGTFIKFIRLLDCMDRVTVKVLWVDPMHFARIVFGLGYQMEEGVFPSRTHGLLQLDCQATPSSYGILGGP